MIEYIRSIKRQFRDVYHFTPEGQYGDELLFGEGQIPDGEYPMTIDGKLDQVQIIDGRIHCGNFEPKAG